MSRKYLEQHSSTGVSNKKVVSKFGMKIMGMLGWNDGEGLGKNKTGITECIQVRKREDNIGLGHSVHKTVNWSDTWWQNSYEKILSNVTIQQGEKIVDKPDEDEDSNTSTTSENEKSEDVKKSKLKSKSKSKNKKVEVDSEEEEEDEISENFICKKRKRTLKVLKF